MNYHKGLSTVATVLIVCGVIVLGIGGYMLMRSEAPVTETTEDGVQTAPGDHPEEDHAASEGMSADSKSSVSWRFTSMGEIEATPYTRVTVTINGTAYEVGTFVGSCSEIGANGGVDGKGLLAGELSAVQCWFAGGGNEIGVFAHEDGGFDILVGELSEGADGAGVFRGDFKVKSSIPL